MRKKAVEEKEKGRERERDGEAAGFLSRHHRSHPTKIDSVSLDSSVQRRATPRIFRPCLERHLNGSLPSSSFSSSFLPPSLSFFPEEPYSIAFAAADVPRERERRREGGGGGEKLYKRVAGDEADRARLDDSYLP